MPRVRIYFSFQVLIRQYKNRAKKRRFITKKHTQDSGGTLEDPDVMKLCGCSRNSYYRYKKEIKHPENG